MKLSRVFKIVGILLVFLGVWYFFIKDYNYKITFKTNQVPAIVYNQIIKYNDGEPSNNKVVSILNKTPFNEIQQELKSGDSVIKLNWFLSKVNDSTTLVTLKVKDEAHSLKQNFQALFFKNSFVKKRISKVQQFGKEINQEAESYKISSVTKAAIPFYNCACISLESTVQNKAIIMLNNIEVLTNYIRDNNLEISNNPFSEITDWNIENDSIKFNFCFPINEMDNYPLSESVKIKKTVKKEALKIVYNGNYRDSDMGWYGIIEYAKSNNISIKFRPFEIYLNDPHQGGNALEWQAEIYMPINE
jgi:effector-binding domain-containing protein